MNRSEDLIVRMGKPRRTKCVTVVRKVRVERPKNLEPPPSDRTRRPIRLQFDEVA